MPTYTMSRQVVVVLYVMAMVAIIVALDFVFFRNRFWERLMVNIGMSWCSQPFTSGSSSLPDCKLRHYRSRRAEAPSPCVLEMRKPQREDDANLPCGARHAGLWQVAGVEFTNGDQP
jgi:hypothetical protein